jgi:hypothetical protein
MKSFAVILAAAPAIAAVGVAAIHYGGDDDAPGLVLIGILLIVGAFAIGVRTAHRRGQGDRLCGWSAQAGRPCSVRILGVPRDGSQSARPDRRRCAGTGTNRRRTAALPHHAQPLRDRLDGTSPVEEPVLCVRLPINPYDVFRREVTIKGSFAQAYSFDRALRSGRLDPAGIITHRFGLDDHGAAPAAVQSGPSCRKAVLRP